MGLSENSHHSEKIDTLILSSTHKRLAITLKFKIIIPYSWSRLVTHPLDRRPTSRNY